MNLELLASSFHIERTPLEEAKLQEVSSWLQSAQKRYSFKRKQEWLAGRYCAKKALSKIGVEIDGLKPLPSRAPHWPRDVVGSISHTDGLAVAIVSEEAKGLGIDCETLMSQSRYERLKTAFVSREEEGLVSLSPETVPTLIFSAKEALYKNVHPRSGCYFGFEEARMLEFDRDTFKLELISNKAALRSLKGVYEGRYAIFENILISWIETI